MNWREFDDKYPTLSGTLASSFHDSADAFDDEGLARSLDSGLALDDRIRLFTGYVADARKLMVNIETDWEVMAAIANRPIRNSEQARAWLLRVIAALQEELGRLQEK